MDEFAELKALVAEMQVVLPPLKEHQRQLLGLYALAALRLGKGEEHFRDCVDGYYAKDAVQTTGGAAQLTVIRGAK